MARGTALLHWCRGTRINLNKASTYVVEEMRVKRVNRRLRLKQIREQLRRGAYVVDSAKLIRAIYLAERSKLTTSGEVQRLQ